jgi:hypothetical protein
MGRYNLIEIIGAINIFIIIVIWSIHNKRMFLDHSKASLKIAMVLLGIGIASITISTIIFAIISRYNVKLIVSLLLLQSVGRWLNRGPIFIGYTLIFWSCIIVAILWVYRKKQD